MCDPRSRPAYPAAAPRFAPPVPPEDTSDRGLSVVLWSWFLTALLIALTTTLVLIAA